MLSPNGRQADHHHHQSQKSQSHGHHRSFRWALSSSAVKQGVRVIGSDAITSDLFSDPYVKVSLMCDGRRLKKRKTSTKRNTLNPAYNEAIVFDVPPESIDQISLLIAVMDYDRLVSSVALLKRVLW